MIAKKIIFGTLSIIMLTVIFIVLDSGGEIAQINQIFSPFIFALAVVGSILIPTARKVFLVVSLALLICMVFIYLINLIELANWLGSLGFGILFVVSVTYLPQFIKRGYIEKF